MADSKLQNRGVALLIVLGTIFVIVLLANIALNIMISQTRLTQHKVGRIQAEYAAWAAINLAFENIRVGAWDVSDCTVAAPCAVADGNFPVNINWVRLTFANPGVGVCNAPAGSFCISAQVQYVTN